MLIDCNVEDPCRSGDGDDVEKAVDSDTDVLAVNVEDSGRRL